MTRRTKVALLATSALGIGTLAGGAALAASKQSGATSVGRAVAATFASAVLDEDTATERKQQMVYTQENERKAGVSKSEAEVIALRAHPGRVVSIHLEDDGAGMEWEIEVDSSGTIWEVNVDAATGNVRDSERDDSSTGEADDTDNDSDDRNDGEQDDD